MKLDAKAIRYLTTEDFRVLAGVLIGPSLLTPRRQYQCRASILC
jgi:hypothetical protein